MYRHMTEEHERERRQQPADEEGERDLEVDQLDKQVVNNGGKTKKRRE